MTKKSKLKELQDSQRLRYLELVLYWEGKINSTRLIDRFGMSRPTASDCIRNYHELREKNLFFNGKYYEASEHFEFQFSSGDFSEYALGLGGEQTFIAENGSDFVSTLYPPFAQLNPLVVRALIGACRQKKRMDVNYVSLNNPHEEGRIIAPHSLFYAEQRWFVRAFCEANWDFRDFRISRFRAGKKSDIELYDQPTAPDYAGNAGHDSLWNTTAKVQICPYAGLTEPQKEVIESDFGMEGGKLVKEVKMSWLNYFFNTLSYDENVVNRKKQQIDIINYEDLDRDLEEAREEQERRMDEMRPHRQG